MKKLYVQNLFKGLLISATVLMIAACGGSGGVGGSQEDMEENIKQAFLNWQNADSGTFNLGFEGDLFSEAVVDESGNELPSEEFYFIGSLEGKSMLKDAETDKYDFEFILDGQGSMNDSELQALGASIVFSEDNLYFKIDDFPALDSPELASVNTIVALFQGKWWSLPVPADVYEQNQVTSWLSLPADSEELTEEQKQLHELYKAAEFFETIDHKGTESVNGVKSDKYRVTLDSEGLFDYAVTYGELSGNPMSVEDQESLMTALETSEIDLMLYVAQKDEYLSRVTADILAESADPTTPGDMDISIDFVFGDFNKPVTITVPEDATPFDFGALLGAPAGGGFEFTE